MMYAEVFNQNLISDKPLRYSVQFHNNIIDPPDNERKTQLKA